jgi:hypothetical protein
MTQLNWDDIEKRIERLDYPLVFLLNIIRYQRKIGDYELSLIIRYFLKNHKKLIMEYPIFLILDILSDEFKITKKIVKDFFYYIFLKVSIIQKINEFESNFFIKRELEGFNKKNINEKIEILRFKLKLFYSYFDCTFGGINQMDRFLYQFKSNSNVMKEEIEWRLIRSKNLFANKFFKYNDILLINKIDFDYLDKTNKLKYIIYYFTKITNLIKNHLSDYQRLEEIDTNIKLILTPIPMYISFGEIISETDTDEYRSLCKKDS